MTTSHVIMWSGLGLVGVLASGMFSGLETGFYRLNRVRLHLRASSGEPTARRLAAMVRSPASTLATLLIGTNIATNLTTSAIGILLESRDLATWQVVLADVLIVTPILFVFAETLPKDLFAAHADRWAYPFAPLLDLLRRVFTWIGLLPLINGLSWLMLRRLRGREAAAVYQPRRHIEALLGEGVGTGLLSDEQSEIVERVLALSERAVRDEMTPWSRVRTVRVDDPPSRLWDVAKQTPWSRFPVVDARGSVVGVVHLYDAMLHGSPDACPPIDKLMQEVLRVRPRMPLREALAELQGHHIPLAVVTDGGRAVGVVTVKDLVEPITGELSRW